MTSAGCHECDIPPKIRVASTLCNAAFSSLDLVFRSVFSVEFQSAMSLSFACPRPFRRFDRPNRRRCRIFALPGRIFPCQCRFQDIGATHSAQRMCHRPSSMDFAMNRMQIKKRSVVFFMVPQFTMLPFSAAVDTLRIANRMLGYQAYTWRLTSVDGEKVYSSCGIGVEANSSLAEE